MFVAIRAYIPFVISGALSNLIACVMRNCEPFCTRPPTLYALSYRVRHFVFASRRSRLRHRPHVSPRTARCYITSVRRYSKNKFKSGSAFVNTQYK
ncbi:hypothetical protein [Choristoneura occidentalis alphabaculovirus]|nr:hypothetical protein [Choristoneura occidentalis alphabaculovirus]